MCAPDADGVLGRRRGAGVTPRPLCLVACGGAKRQHPAQAGALYIGAYFTACLKTAYRLTEPDMIRILSAKHGLLRLTDIIAPYNLRLGNVGAIDGVKLRAQACHANLLDHSSVVILGGRDYVALARTVWPQAQAPIAGLALGFAMRRLKEMREQIARGAAGRTAAVAPQPTKTGSNT